MIPSIFANAKNALTITISLSATLSCTFAADDEKEAISSPFTLPIQQIVRLPEASSAPFSPRHRYQSITLETSPSYQWATEHATPKRFRLSLNSPSLPTQIDFGSKIFIRDQDNVGMCTAVCVVITLEYYFAKTTDKSIKFSPLFVYYNERKLRGTIEQDVGASLTDAIQAITIFGACQEATWPSIDDNVKFKERPSDHAYKEPHEIFKGLRFRHSHLSNNLEIIKHVLSEKNPVLCGINVFPSFESEETEKTGIVPMPDFYEPPIGAHAITLVGYDDTTERLKFANSWGVDWGDKGYGYLPYNYFTNQNINNQFTHTYSSEIWSVKLEHNIRNLKL